MNCNASNELAWTAFRYIADELGEPERRAFERQLAEDQAAREALAEAIEWTEATCMACEELGAQGASVAGACRRRKWLQRVVWAVSGAAASLLLVLAFQQGDPPARSIAKRAPLEIQSTRLRISDELATAWSATFANTSGPSSEAFAVLESQEPWLVEDSAITTAADWQELAADSALTPAWMFAAISGLSAQERAEPQPPPPSGSSLLNEQGS